MRYTVTWKPSAENELISIWLAASSEERAQITDAVRLAELMLRFSPERLGECRSGGERIFFLASLALTIEIRDLDCIATILSVHRMPAPE